ncbi:MAG: hypothetical protein ACOVOV_02030, partial [Dolichospermum sp.]
MNIIKHNDLAKSTPLTVLASGKWSRNSLKLLLTANPQKLFLAFAFLLFSLASQAQLSVNSVNTNPYCIGGNTGIIAATASGGTAPYIFQMLSPIGAPISNGTATATFTGLAAGTYQYRVTDNTGAFQTRTVVLTNPLASQFQAFQRTVQPAIACDSVPVYFYTQVVNPKPGYKFDVWLNASTASGLPNMTVYTNNSNPTINLPYTTSTSGTHFIRVTDSCGLTRETSFNVFSLDADPFLSKVVCNQPILLIRYKGLKTNATFNLYSGSTATGVPLQTAVQTNPNVTPADSGYIIADQGYLGAIFPLNTAGTYTIQAIDDCGRTMTRTINYTPVIKNVPVTIIGCNSYSALDSSAQVTIWLNNLSGTKTLTFLSGPTTYNSTLHQGFVNNTITYPQTFTSPPNATNRGMVLTPGTYKVAISDTCNWKDTLTITVSSSQVSAYQKPYYIVTPGCLNANTIQYGINSKCNTPQSGYLQLMYNGASVDLFLIGGNSSRTVVNRPSGRYFLRMLGLFGTPLVAINSGSLTYVDSFDVAPYTGAIVNGSAISPCPNTGLGSILAKPIGVAPYTFELLGPVGNNTVIRTSQTDSLFNNLPLTDSFRIRVTDGCGNATVSSNISFRGIALNAGASSSIVNCISIGGSATFIADSMGSGTTYVWSGPNGFTSTQRVATRNITSYADSGLYKVVTTSLSGCKDSAYIRLALKPNAGADQTLNCILLPGGSATMAATSIGAWTSQAGNPGSATITTPSSATTTITNFSVAGTYKFLFTSGTCSDTTDIVVTSKPNAGANQSIVCFATDVATMAGTGTGTWTAMAGNPGTATITTPT